MIAMLSSLRPSIVLNPKSIAFISEIFVLIDYIFFGGGHVSECRLLPLAHGYIVCLMFLCSFYRQDAAKQQTAGIKFTHRPKSRFFAPQGRLVTPIHVKLGRAEGHVGPLGCAKFHLNRHRGVGMQPQNIKNFHFLVKSRPTGATPLTDF